MDPISRHIIFYSILPHLHSTTLPRLTSHQSLAKERNLAEMLSLFEKPIVKEDGQSSSRSTRGTMDDERDSMEVKEMGEFPGGKTDRNLRPLKEEDKRKGQTTSRIPEENFTDRKKEGTGREASKDKGNIVDETSGDREITGGDAVRDKLDSIVKKEPTLPSPSLEQDRIQTAGSREESMNEKEKKGEDVGSSGGEKKRNRSKIDLKGVLESQLIGQRFAVEQVKVVFLT